MLCNARQHFGAGFVAIMEGEKPREDQLNICHNFNPPDYQSTLEMDGQG